MGSSRPWAKPSIAASVPILVSASAARCRTTLSGSSSRRSISSGVSAGFFEVADELGRRRPDEVVIVFDESARDRSGIVHMQGDERVEGGCSHVPIGVLQRLADFGQILLGRIGLELIDRCLCVPACLARSESRKCRQERQARPRRALLERLSPAMPRNCCISSKDAYREKNARGRFEVNPVCQSCPPKTASRKVSQRASTTTSSKHASTSARPSTSRGNAVVKRPQMRYLSYYGFCLAKTNRPVREAIHACRTAALTDGRNPDLFLILGRVYLMARRYQRGVEVPLSSGLRVGAVPPGTAARARASHQALRPRGRPRQTERRRRSAGARTLGAEPTCQSRAAVSIR